MNNIYSKIIYILFFFVICIPVFSSGQTKFQRTYGGSLINEGRSVKQTLDGGYIIAGSTSSFGYGATDVLLIKTDSLGNTQFMKTYGGSNIDIGYSVLQLSDSGYVIAGYTNSFGAGGYDAYLVRTDKNGDTLWTKTYGGSNWDFIYSLKQASDGGFVMAGNTYSYGNGNSNGWIIKTNSNGDTLWTKVFLTDEDVVLSSVDLGFNDRYITTGYETNVTSDSSNIIAANISSSGDSLWFYSYEDTLNIEARVIHSISDSTYVIGGKVIVDSSQSNSFLMKIDSLGNMKWYNTLVTNTGFNDLYDFVELPSDSIVALGSTTGVGYIGSIDIHLVFASKDGFFAHAPTFGGAGNDIGYSIEQTTDGGFVIVGETNTWRPGLQAVYLVKTDSVGITTPVGIHELKNDLTKLIIYPDPCIDYTYIRISNEVSYINTGVLSLNIYNVLGENLFSENVLPDQTIKINTSALASGVYFVQLKSGGNITGSGKLIVR